MSRIDQIIELEKMAKKVLELKKEYHKRRPIIIEFCGCPKSGKTSAITALNIFLKRNGFKTKILTERASVCPVEDKHHPFFNIWTSCAMLAELIQILSNYTNDADDHKIDIIIADRGIFDSLTWFEFLKNKKRLDEKEQNILNDFLTMDFWISKIDLVYIFTARAEISIIREYANLLTTKPGTIMKNSVLDNYKKAVEFTSEKFHDNFLNIEFIDTSDHQQADVNKMVTEKTLTILNEMLNEKIGFFSEELIKHLNEGITKFEEFKNILKRQKIELEFGFRKEIEELYKIQPIPIVVFTDKDKKKVLVVKKKEIGSNKKSPEKNKLLIYVGGHVRKEDGFSKGEDIFIKTLKREIEEEVGITIDMKGIEPFIIYKTDLDRSKRHLAICYVVEIDFDETDFKLRSDELVKKTGSSKSGTVYDVKKLIREIKPNLELESWSKEILTRVFKIEGLNENDYTLL